MLERSFILAEVSCKLTLEAREWDRLLDHSLTIRKVVLARVTSLYSALVPMPINVIGSSASISNSEIFARSKNPMEGAHSVR
jgi:hypothetical protein